MKLIEKLMMTEKNVEYLVGELKIKDDIVMDLVFKVNKLEEKMPVFLTENQLRVKYTNVLNVTLKLFLARD